MGFWDDAGNWYDENVNGTINKFFPDRAKNQFTGTDQQGNLAGQSSSSSNFADAGERNFGRLGAESAAVRDRLSRLAEGKYSISAEQLRQGLQQNLAGQQAMAASARPGNAAMAARQASTNAYHAGSAMAGQQAIAGLAERQQANAMLGQMLDSQRQQELQAALQGRQNALAGYGKIEDANTSRFNGMIQTPTSTEGKMGFLGDMWKGAGLMSDERLKKDVADGGDLADEFVKSLRSVKYSYKDEKYGKGQQVGIMAQDLLKSHAGRQAVVPTKDGLAVDGAKLSAAIASALPGLDQRLAALEGKK